MFPVFRRLDSRRLALAAAALACPTTIARAQDAAPALDAGALDPASPMAPLPDLGVDWPDLATPNGALPTASTTTVDGASLRRYRFAIEGLNEVGGVTLRPRFDALSTLKAGEGDSANVAQIDRRAREDADTLRDLLRAYGYYDAVVRPRVEAGAGDAAIAVTLEAEPGPVYRFAEVAAPGIATAGPRAQALDNAFPIKPGDVVDADRVLGAQNELKTALGREGFAFGTVGELDVVVDHATRTATLALAVAPGGEQRFGAIAVTGERPLFSAKHIGRIARFDPGQRYDAALVEDLRRALIQTSLVSSVAITPTPSQTPGVVDLGIALERAPPRTIAGELGYGTGEGVRTEISWTHRNRIPPEGAVTLRGVLGTQEQQVGASLRRSNFKARDRVLTAQIAAANINRDAFDARTFTLTGGLERQSNILWQKDWTWSAGAELVATDERDTVRATGASRRRTFFIAALPGSLGYDASDDLLNPTRGFRLLGRVSPEVSLQGGTFVYARLQADATTYAPVSDRVTLAGRLRLGSIAGAEREQVAPSRRFYAGGGGSVRGYGFQDIGPLDVDGDPIGGRSLAEASIEARVRFGDFGIVPFIDAGNIYTEALPRFTGLRYGAGIGARYYTSFGPIRVDVGTPINRRAGDARVAVYVSLGQAF